MRDKIRKQAVLYFGAVMSLFHIWVLGFSPMETWSFRALHLGFALVLLFLQRPFKARSEKIDLLVDVICILASIISCLYIAMNSADLVLFIQFKPSTLDILICTMGVLLVLECTRRANGLPMPILAIFFLAYGWFGKYIPGMLGHQGYSFARVIAYSFSLDGVFGVSLGVSATFLIIFVIFGAILESTGGTHLFIEGAMSFFGRFRGGAGKVAIAAAALMGTITGHSAGNVVATGTFTIPLMLKTGYKPNFASAVSAVASTGGQIMPPIMGAGAFIMAQTLNIPYLKIAVAAAIPAILYFYSVFVMVDAEAKRLELVGLSKEELPRGREILRDYGHLLIPLFVMLYYLIIIAATPIKAGLYGIYTCLIIALLRKASRYDLKGLLKMLSAGATGATSVVSACACAGIIIGALTLTGLGNKIASLIIAISHGNLLVALLVSMVVLIIMGMGLPTTAAYIITSSVVAPALSEMGIAPIVAHMFIFYYACLSAITPPVAIASYAAAGIAKTNPNVTGWMALKLGLAAFIVPFMFVYSPTLLAQGDALTVVYSALTAIVGIYLFSISVFGWYRGTKLVIFPRALMFVGSLCLVDDATITNIVGIALASFAIVYHRRLIKNKEMVSNGKNSGKS
jgi:TRAP transporter 4TM/12TM fusion protein